MPGYGDRRVAEDVACRAQPRVVSGSAGIRHRAAPKPTNACVVRACRKTVTVSRDGKVRGVRLFYNKQRGFAYLLHPCRSGLMWFGRRARLSVVLLVQGPDVGL